MHDWEDENVDWGGINDAGDYIGLWLRRWTRMNVSTIKEKFGTLRIYCSFGWDTFYSIAYPGYMHVKPWWPYKLDLLVCRNTPIMRILSSVASVMQARAYAWRYKKAVQKWPHLYKEIVCGADWGELFEGTVPGYKHSNFWTEVKSENTNTENR